MPPALAFSQVITSGRGGVGAGPYCSGPRAAVVPAPLASCGRAGGAGTTGAWGGRAGLRACDVVSVIPALASLSTPARHRNVT
jgi:hypothetical protein